MRRPLRITYTGNRNCAYVTGNGARGLLAELRGRAPMWSQKHRGYAVTEATARDAQAAAEGRGWFVLTSGEPSRAKVPVQVGPSKEGPTCTKPSFDGLAATAAPADDEIPLW